MNLQSRLRRVYRCYVAGYRRYLRQRGYGNHLNDWPFVLRGFLACWAEPGLHRFWQVWNPGIGYLTFQLYLALGGRENREAATLATFVLNGLVHTVIVCPFFGRWAWTLIVAFLLFGLLTILNRWLAPVLRQERWPTVLNLVANISSILLSFDVGFRVNELLC